jgi:hypothetical protein
LAAIVPEAKRVVDGTIVVALEVEAAIKTSQHRRAALLGG